MWTPGEDEVYRTCAHSWTTPYGFSLYGFSLNEVFIHLRSQELGDCMFTTKWLFRI